MQSETLENQSNIEYRIWLLFITFKLLQMRSQNRAYKESQPFTFSRAKFCVCEWNKKKETKKSINKTNFLKTKQHVTTTSNQNITTKFITLHKCTYHFFFILILNIYNCPIDDRTSISAKISRNSLLYNLHTGTTLYIL